MTVLTTHRPAEPLAHYEQLTPIQQHTFDAAMERAETARDADRYNTAMANAAFAIGYVPTEGAEIVKCACEDCYCDAIFDTSGPGLRTVDTTDYGLPLYQCATCTDAHPAPHED